MFTVVCHASQLRLVRDALAASPSYDESEHLLVGMIDDALAARESGDTETVLGFCY